MKIQFIAGKPVTTTNFHQVKPLGMDGKLILESWRFLFDFLKQNMGIQYASLFLEPVIDPQRGEVDWYIPTEVLSSPQQTLSREEAVRQARQRLEQIYLFAQTLLKDSNASQQQNGRLVLEALHYPDVNAIIATPYGPALVAWGHERNPDIAPTMAVSAKGMAKPLYPMQILPAPSLSYYRRQLLKAYIPWLCVVLFLLLMLLLPWWQGIFPVDYCRYYWSVPAVFFLISMGIFFVLLTKAILVRQPHERSWF